MKHLHRKNVHFYICVCVKLCACACFFLSICPVCNVTTKQKANTRYEKKMNVMRSQKYMKYIRCFMRYSRFRVFVNAIEMYAMCVHVRSFMRFIYNFYFPAEVFDGKKNRCILSALLDSTCDSLLFQ